MEKQKETRIQRLTKALSGSLSEEISLVCQHHGPKTFTIGKFLESQTACALCKSQLPIWHKDQLVAPVMIALNRLRSDEENERKEKAKAEKEAINE